MLRGLNLASLVVGFIILGFTMVYPAAWKKFEHLPEPVRPFRPIFVALLLNDLAGNWSFQTFEASQLIYQAKSVTGLTNLYDDSENTFRIGLEQLSKSIQQESSLNFLGRVLLWTQLDITI